MFLVLVFHVPLYVFTRHSSISLLSGIAQSCSKVWNLRLCLYDSTRHSKERKEVVIIPFFVLYTSSLSEQIGGGKIGWPQSVNVFAFLRSASIFAIFHLVSCANRYLFLLYLSLCVW